MSESSSPEEPLAEEGPADAKAIADDAALVVLEPCAEERTRIESLQEAVGRTVWVMDPDQFGTDMMDEVAEAGALIVEWDLGTRLGLDVVASLVADERTSGVRVALASATPTRSMVEAALRAGAWTFLVKPYEADEIVRRLIPRPKGAGEPAAEADAAAATQEEESAA